VIARIVAAAVLSASPLFSSYDVIPLELKAPFNDLFEHARTDDKYAVTGTLSYDARGTRVTVDGVRVTLRGNTSRRDSECAFPKLKVQFPAGKRPDGFGGLGSIKLGTHCGEAPDDGVTVKFGRLPNEHSPVREVFVYRLLEALGVPSLKARQASITYVYTDAKPGQTPPQDRPLVRQAMIVEDTDAAIKRFGGTRDIGEKAFTNARAQFDAADTARLAFAEALIGNFDWCVKMTPDDTYRCDARHPLWNVLAAAGSSGQARPILYDFDVAGIVTGRHPWFRNVFNEAFAPSKSAAETEVIAQVQRTRTLFSRRELDAARGEFVKRKSEAYRALDEASLDDNGRKIARRYLDAFYRAIESDDAFYRPVVTSSDARLYATENRDVVCAAGGPVPQGTPVSDPLQTRGTLMQVLVLDALWRWAPPVKCSAVHEGPVWIETAAVSRDFPLSK